MAMSTAPTTFLVDDIVPTICDLKGLAGKADLTIHRLTDTHHGATLRILGHAAEYLVETRILMTSNGQADAEAIHLLMRLSREIFDEYANGVAVRGRFHDWVIDRIVQRYD